MKVYNFVQVESATASSVGQTRVGPWVGPLVGPLVGPWSDLSDHKGHGPSANPISYISMSEANTISFQLSTNGFVSK
jgi:hypothetical protein